MSPSATRVVIGDPPLDNPHADNGTPHYRLYLVDDGTPVVICVQDFDYPDYAANRFLTTQMWLDETDAHAELSRLLTGAVEASNELPAAWTLHSIGAPLTRAQAVAAYASRTLRPHPETATPTAGNLAMHLRLHAFENQTHDVTLELMRMADRLDGGTGTRVHHGCPDESVPTADCRECWMVLGAEADWVFTPRSMFAARDYSTD